VSDAPPHLRSGSRAVGKKASRVAEDALAILNGLIGDRLERTGNGLAIDMACHLGGAPVELTGEGLSAAYPAATDRLVVLVHGLMCTETVWTMPDGTDYGSRLAADLGMTPVYVRYNTGRAIPDSGVALAALLDALVAAWPVPVRALVPIGYSMGGLVIRAATHVAGLGNASFLPLVERAIYVGTPHQGAPLERAGRVVTRVLRAIDDPYTQLIADIASLRSEGLQDLGDADVRHDDRARRSHGWALRDPEHPVPLLESIEHHLIAGSLSTDPRMALLFGDALVPIPSGSDGALRDAATMGAPPAHVAYLPGLDHVTLAHHPLVYEKILAWLAVSTPGEPGQETIPS
jgi:triacylglycerol lipase